MDETQFSNAREAHREDMSVEFERSLEAYNKKNDFKINYIRISGTDPQHWAITGQNGSRVGIIAMKVREFTNEFTLELACDNKGGGLIFDSNEKEQAFKGTV